MKKLIFGSPFLALALAACGGGGNPSADTTPPNVQLSGSLVGSTVNLTADVTDASPITKVEFYRGNTLISTDATAPYTAAQTVTSADNGNVVYTAKATDKSGNVGQSSTTVAVNIAPPQADTLYQGFWGYAYGSYGDERPTHQGAVAFVDEVEVDYGTVALGAYSNEAKTRVGSALMGPISQRGKLEAYFAQDLTTNAEPYLMAIDDDNRFELFEGAPTFFGDAILVSASGHTVSEGMIAIVQASSERPDNVLEQQALQQSANALAARYLQQRGISVSSAADFGELQVNVAKLMQQ